MAAKKSPKPLKARKSAREIAEAAMPGWRAVPEEEEQQAQADAFREAGSAPPPDANLPDLATLRGKYLKGADAGAQDAEANPAPDDTQVVTMKSGPLKKKVGVKAGKVTWFQG